MSNLSWRPSEIMNKVGYIIVLLFVVVYFFALLEQRQIWEIFIV